jgi:predicted nicotinamide N-methyase
LADRAMTWLKKAAGLGARVLIGDPGRTYFPKTGLVKLAEYSVATTRELEDSEIKRTCVWTFPT